MLLGELKMGQKLSSTRELAREYQINPNTASRVYREMEQEGLCYTLRGTGTFVTEEEKIWKKLRTDMAEESLAVFCQRMKFLGITEEETLELVREQFRRIMTEQEPEAQKEH